MSVVFTASTRSPIRSLPGHDRDYHDRDHHDDHDAHDGDVGDDNDGN